MSLEEVKEAVFQLGAVKAPAPDPLCPVCKKCPETIEHLFLLCPSLAVSRARFQSTLVPAIWTPPEKGALKLNVDVAFVAGSTPCAMAGVCQDSSVKLMGGFACLIRAQSPLQAEALALLQGVRYMKERRRENMGREVIVEVESDSPTVVQSITCEDQPLWDVEVLIK